MGGERQAAGYDFAGKTVLVMGLGRFGGGVDVAKFVHNAGAKVIITDLATADQLSDSIKELKEYPDIEFHLGTHHRDDFKKSDVIIINPAVAPDNEFLEFARRHNKFITSQINIFFELCPATIIGITGANGKSTTAALTAHLLKAGRHKGSRHDICSESVITNEAKQSQIRNDQQRATRYENVWLSGNIGHQPLLTIIDQISSTDLVVLELSSFQLEQLAQIQKAPKVALLTNLTPNHFDRYGNFVNYCSVKENIFKFQKKDDKFPSVSIFNAEDKVAAEWFEKYRRDTGRICTKFSAEDVAAEIRAIFPLPGRANLSNLAAAIAIAGYFGISVDQIKSCLSEFKPLPHRLEFAGQINGVCWYNDSKATTPQSAVAALEAFDRPIIIIAGGYDKNLSFEELGRTIARKAKAAILMGQTAEKIANAVRHLSCAECNTQIIIVDSMQQAVESADNLAVCGDIVLLSPACASYDMFDNFQQRGQQFVKLVKALKTKG